MDRWTAHALTVVLAVLVLACIVVIALDRGTPVIDTALGALIGALVGQYVPSPRP